VGKTTLAAASALGLAARRQRTLLVSTDPAHSTGDILQVQLGSEPRAVVADFWAMEIDPAVEADRYIESVKRRISESVAPRLLDEIERQIDIARVSPGAEEAALFERFTKIIEQEGEGFERIVFDTAPTGQTLRLLSLPELMSTWIGGLISRRKKVTAMGRMWRNVAGSSATEASEEDPVLRALEERRARFHRAREALTDARMTAFVFVLVPERLPIWETEKAVGALSKYGIPVGAVLVNQVLPATPTEEFLVRRKEREAEHLARIERVLGDWPIVRVPLLERDPVGVDALQALAARLATRV
jgi:arsenite-transporting ATPase